MAFDLTTIRRALQFPWVPARLGIAPYVWPSSFGFFIWKYLYVPPSVLEISCLLLSIAVFFPIYFGSFWAKGRVSVLLALLSTLLGALWAPHNFGANTFFIFACGMCAGIEQRRNAYLMLASILVVAITASLSLGDAPLAFIIPTMIVGIPVGISSIADVRVRRTNETLLRKQEEVEHIARIAERERISRDMHDLLGHTLSLITIKAELAGKLVGRDADACRSEIKDIEQCARHALAEVRSAVTGYRQTGFAHELAGAKASLAAAQVELTVEMQECELTPAIENVLALALREAVTNIVRHAGATRCTVTLSGDDSMIVLRISDNGQSLAAGAPVKHGNGLTGMGERVAALGGKLAVIAANGLSLEMSLPRRAAA
jgi:two-component system sensor histidine kinase DesK